MGKNFRRIIWRDNKGFSLTELLIVIAIMAILAAALTPVVIHFIDKSRKAVDIETAQVLFEAAELASASNDDDASEGWSIPVTTRNTAAVARTTVNAAGHNTKYDSSRVGTYDIACIAWCRGVEFSSSGSNKWENSQFKSTLDNAGNKEADTTRAYTNEFLKNLYHLDGVDQVYSGTAGANKYDGWHEETMVLMRYKKNPGMGYPECWMVCVRCDNYKPEIWIGDKNLNGRRNGGKVAPIYRLYPDPCKEYK